MAKPPVNRAPIPVTFVASHAGHGGSERYLEILTSNLEAGWIDRVISLQNGPLVATLRERGHEVEVVEAPARRGIPAAALRLRRTLAQRRPRLVHANGVKAALVTVLATAGTRTPVVWAKHDFSWDGPLARMVARRCTEVVTVSAALTAALGPRTARRVHVVPAPIPDPRVERADGRPRVVELLGSPPDAPVVTHAGRIQPSKGQLELMEAVPEILDGRPDAHFLFVGGERAEVPEYARELRARCRALELEGAVTVLGHRSDAVTLISGSDVLVVPSMPDARGRGREGTPLVAMEALAVGTPVVGYDHGGIPDAVGDAGRLVPAGDRGALAQTVLEVLASPELRERMAAAGRERVWRRNRPEVMAGAMMERYRAAAEA